MPLKISVSSIFCEDIREESSGQFSFIGVYGGGQIAFKEFPAVLDRLAIYCSIKYIIEDGSGVDEIPQSPPDVKVFAGDDVVFDSNVWPELENYTNAVGGFIERVPSMLSRFRDVTPTYVVNPIIYLRNIKLPEAGPIKVRVSARGESFRGGVLMVEAQEQQ